MPRSWPSARSDLSLARSTSPTTAPPRSAVARARSRDVLVIGVVSPHGLGQSVDQVGFGVRVAPGKFDRLDRMWVVVRVRWPAGGQLSEDLPVHEPLYRRAWS